MWISTTKGVKALLKAAFSGGLASRHAEKNVLRADLIDKEGLRRSLYLSVINDVGGACGIMICHVFEV